MKYSELKSNPWILGFVFSSLSIFPNVTFADQFFIGNPPVPVGANDLGTPYNNTVTLDSTNPDELLIDNGGLLQPTVAGDPAVLINVNNVGEQPVNITNRGTIFSNNVPVNAMIETSAGTLGANGLITIINDGLRRTTAPIDAQGGTLDGNVAGTNITFFGNTVLQAPVIIRNINDATIQNGIVNLSSGALSTQPVTLRMGTAGFNDGGSLTNASIVGDVDVAGNGRSRLEILGGFTLTGSNGIQNVAVIQNNTQFGTAFTVDDPITDNLTFITEANATTNINANILDLATAPGNTLYSNAGTSTLLGATLRFDLLTNGGIFTTGQTLAPPANTILTTETINNFGTLNSRDFGVGGNFLVTTFNNNPGSFFNINNPAIRPLDLTAVTFTNTGTVNLSTPGGGGTGFLEKADGLTNDAIWNQNPGANLDVGLSDFTNNGTFNLFAGSTFAGNSFINNGTLNINGGSTFTRPITANIAGNVMNVLGNFTTGNTITDITTINVTGGIFNINNVTMGFTNFNTIAGTTTNLTSQLTGSGLSQYQNRGTTNLQMGSICTVNSVTNFSTGILNALQGSTLTITSLVNRGLFSLTSALSLAGSNIDNANGSFNINGPGTFTITSGTFTNAGTVNVNIGGTLTGITANYTNTAITNIFNGGSLEVNGLQNSGTFNAMTGSQLNITSVNNSGTFNLGSNLSLSGSNFTNTGNFTINNNGVFSGNSTNPFVNAGFFTISNGGTINVSNFTNNNVVNANAGSLLSFTNLTNPGTFNLASNLTIGNNFSNTGTFNINNGGILTGNSGSTVNNAGNFTVNNGGRFNGSGATLVNSSNFSLLPGGNVSAASFVNNGTLTIYGGNLNAPLTSTIASPSVNIVGNFTSTNTISNIPTISVANSGTNFNIQNAVTGLSTLNMSPNTSTTLLSGGSITSSGLVLNNAGTLTMNGGSLATNLTGTSQSTFNVASDYSSQGSITGVGTILASGGNFTVNAPISGYSLFKNSATVTLNGGTLSGGMQGNGPGSTLIINQNFTTAGVLGDGIPLGTITINNGATLNLKHTINVSSNTLNNNGVLALTNTQVVNGSFFQSASGSFNTTFLNNQPGNFGQLAVSGPATVGGTLNISLLDNGNQINNNDTFDIITAGSLTDSSTLVAPQNLVLSFSKDQSSPPNIIRILATRTPLNVIAGNNPSTTGVANSLDFLRKNSSDPEIRFLFSQLSLLQNQQAFSDALTALLPLDANGANVMTALRTQDILLEKITNRLDAQRRARKRILTLEGYNAGDLREIFEPGAFFFFNGIKQARRDNFDGYCSTTGGVGILGDIPIDCFSKMGVALNYAGSGIKTDTTGSKTDICSLQASVYGSYEYGYGFVDGILSLGTSQYKGRRHINFLNQTATGNFKGHQSNGLVRAGLDFIFDIFQIIPLVSLESVHVYQGGYTESGAAPTLVVNPNRARALQSGYGFKMAFCDSDVFIPEIHVMALNFIKNPNVVINSQFAIGGPAFITPSAPVPKTGMDYGAGLTAILSPDIVLTAKYDFVVRGKHNFTAHYFSLKFRYLF